MPLVRNTEVEDLKLIDLWSKAVGDTIAKYDVLEGDIFNSDETSFQMGVISNVTSKVITTSGRKGRPRIKQAGNRKWVITIEVTSAKGKQSLHLSSSMVGFIKRHSTKLASRLPEKSL